MHQLLLIDNILTIDTFEGFGKTVIAAIAIDQLLDLIVVELLVGENGQIGADRTEDTVGAERDDGVVIFLYRSDKVVDVGLGLDDR